ncbi:hypothetical protein VP02_03470 [Pseudomonas ogarae]|uniref:Uncharacterized protein n=1 Tax=Pseudomonas kilonensis TaxID=132476 RepID=A0A0F4XUS7_9PSED|nr:MULTISPECIES: hypothetical protein [Pseudomonas]KKA09590.1 hypothetical protein VP02_03470 [Pseudomonas ogarae]PBJ12468.1 hypothetical protein BSF43_20480 [Pseudomonas ogarae]QXH97719.1 hypothetical protein HU749_015375 [Pseudomonas zarinae]
MRILKALLLPFLLILSLIGVDRLSGKHKTSKHPQPHVGAGLLAKAAVLSIPMPADPPLSRASPLPQGICGVHIDCEFIPAMGR